MAGRGATAEGRAEPGTRPRVLVVDDEVFIAEALTLALRHAGYDTRCAFTAADARALAAAWSPDLVVLDVMLPDGDGFEVCRDLVTSGIDTAVLFLTARDDVADRLRGFGVGADDYVTKPFSLEEVIARVRAVLLRAWRGDADGVGAALLRYADLTMDDQRHDVTRAGRRITLSPTEYVLLRYFLQHPEQVLSKAQILDHVWRYDFGGNTGVVETFVSLVRKKLNTAGPPLIHTVRGFGYVLRTGE